MGNIANYRKHNYFSDVDVIDNVTLRLWKFSDVCSRYTAGIAGDDIMFHILVAYVMMITYALNPVMVQLTCGVCICMDNFMGKAQYTYHCISFNVMLTIFFTICAC